MNGCAPELKWKFLMAVIESLTENSMQGVCFVLAIAGVLVATFDAGIKGSSFWLGPDQQGGEPLDGGEKLPYRPDWFHGVFMLASAYLAMVRTLQEFKLPHEPILGIQSNPKEPSLLQTFYRFRRGRLMIF